jgi:4a-hydroxytetrahydrobiopterin dehydratase
MTKKDRERTGVTGEERDLASLTCEECRDATAPLPSERIAALLWQLDDWEVVEGHHLAKAWKFRDFASALAFVDRIGALADKEGHHPDLALGWGYVRCDLHTHKVDGLTDADFVLAAKIDRIPPAS